MVLAIAAVDLLDGRNFNADVDDRLRLLQLRELIAGAGWFDRTLSAISMPETYVSPWSRLVDLPYFAIARALEPFSGQDAALRLATLIWPPVLLFALAAITLATSLRLVEKTPPLPALFIMAASMVLAVWDFTPGRIDHHNLQIVLLLAVVNPVVRRDGRGGAVMGLATVASVAIGLELVPVLAVLFAWLGIMAAVGHKAEERLLATTSVTIVGAAPLAGLALIGPTEMAAVQCDSYSLPWVAVLTGGGLVALISMLFWRWLDGIAGRSSASALRLTALLVPVGLFAALLAWLFPACQAGPYPMIDAVSSEVWFDLVAQEQSILTTPRVEFAVMVGLMAAIATATCWSVLARPGERRLRAAPVMLTLAAALVLCTTQLRFLRFCFALFPLLVPLALEQYDAMGARSRSVLLAGICGLAVLLCVPRVMAGDARGMAPTARVLINHDSCAGADFSAAASLPPGRILATLALATEIAVAAPGHTLAAVPFHRATPGIGRMAAALLSDDAAERREALAPIDLIAVCRREIPAGMIGNRTFAALVAGSGWPGLEPVGMARPGELQFYRVQTENLR